MAYFDDLLPKKPVTAPRKRRGYFDDLLEDEEEVGQPIQPTQPVRRPFDEKRFFQQEQAPVEKKPQENIFRQALDIPVNIGRGGVQGIKMMTDLLGADNPISKSLSGVEGYLADMLSAQAKDDQEEIARILKDAEDKGFGEQVMAGIKAFSIAPVDIMSQAMGTMIPVVATGLAGSAAKLGAVGIRAVQAGVGAGSGAGMTKGNIYSEVKNELLNAGISEEKAEAAAVEAQSYGGKNLDSILFGAGLGAISTLGAESILTRILTKQGKPATAATITRALKGGVTEMVPEAAQAAEEQRSINVALQREGFDVPTTRGVVSAAAMEGLAGAAIGAPVGALERPAAIKPKTPAQEKLEQMTDVARNAAQSGAPATASVLQDQAAEGVRQEELARQLAEELEAEERPMVPIQEEKETYTPAEKEEFKKTFAKQTPESLAATEAGFTNNLTSADADVRAFAQTGLEALAEFRQEQQAQPPTERATEAPSARKLPTEGLPTETPGAAYGREAEMYDVFAGVTRRPLVPTQPIPTDATQEILQQESLRAEPQDRVEIGETEGAIPSGGIPTPEGSEAQGQVINDLRSVAENTANREQISALSAAGLVDIIKGQPVINEDGEAILAQAQAPLPRLTPEERVAEIQAAPAPTKEAIASAANVATRIEKENQDLDRLTEFNPPTLPTLQDARSLPDAVAKKGKTLSISGGKQEKNILNPRESKKRFDEIGYERQELELPDDMNDRVSERYGGAVANIKSLYSPQWLGAHFHGGVAINENVRGTQRGRVIAHELGHASHSLLGDRINKDQNVLNELKAVEEMLYPGLREKVSTAKKPDANFFNYLLSPNELIAEFNVERISNPDRANQVAPNLSALLESAEKMKGIVADRKTFPVFLGTIRESKERIKVKGLEARKVERGTQDVLTNKNKQWSEGARAVLLFARKNDLEWAKMAFRNLRSLAPKSFVQKTAELTGNQELINYVEELYPTPAPAPTISEKPPTSEIVSPAPAQPAPAQAVAPVAPATAPTIGEKPPTSPMIGAEPTQPAPAEGVAEPSRAVTTAPETAAEPAVVPEREGAPAPEAPAEIAVGSRVKKTVGKGVSFYTYKVTEVLPQTEAEIRNGEQSYLALNEQTGKIEEFNTNDGPVLITGKSAQRLAAEGRAEKVTPVQESDRYGFEDAVIESDRIFGGEIPPNFAIITDPDNKEFEFKAAYDPNDGMVILNLAFIRKGDNLQDIISHELGHYLYGDPEFQSAFEEFWNAMTPEQQALGDEIIQSLYNKNSGQIQVEEKQVRAFMSLIEEANAQPQWRKVLDAIKRWFNRVFGTEFQTTDRGALDVLAAGVKRFGSGEQIIRAEVTERRMAAQTQDARFAELEARARAGDKEAEAEAQRMVDEAARAAGYAIDSYHGTNGDLFTVFSTEAGGDKTFAESARLGIFSTNNPDVAQTYAENIGAGGTFALTIGQGPLVEARDRAIATPEFESLKQAKDVAEKEYSFVSNRIYDQYVEKEKAQLNTARDAFRSMLQGKTETEIDQFIEEVAERGASRAYVADEAVNKNPEIIAAQDKINEASKAINDYIYPFLLDALPNVRVMQLKLQIKNPKVYDAKGQTPADFSLSDKIQEAKDLGHDGVIFENIIDPKLPATHYVVFKPEQIKSADPFTYDDAGNLIPLSERFQTTSPDIRMMAAEGEPATPDGEKKGTVYGNENAGRRVTTPPGFLKMTDDIIKRDYFDAGTISQANTEKAFGLIEAITDLDEGFDYARSIVTDVAAKMPDVPDAQSKSVAVVRLQNELMSYARKLAIKGDLTLMKHLFHHANQMETGLSLNIERSARSMRARKRIRDPRRRDMDPLAALHKMENPIIALLEVIEASDAEQAAAAIFGTKNPTEEQVLAVIEALEMVRRTKMENEGEILDGLADVESRVGKPIDKKVREAIDKSGKPKKEELLFSFSNLNQDRKVEGINIVYRPQKVSPAKNIQDKIIGKLVDYRKTLVKQGANGLESTFWQTMSDQERKLGPLGEIDQAQNAELARIVQDVLKKKGLKGEPPNTKMTDIEKVASMLSKQELGAEKRVEADKAIVEQIEERRQNELETAKDKDAVNAKYDAILDAWNEAMSRQVDMPVSDAMLQRMLYAEMKEMNIDFKDLIASDDGKLVADTKLKIVNSILDKIRGVTGKELELFTNKDFSALYDYFSQTFDNAYKIRVEKKNAQIAKRKAEIESRNGVAGQAQAVIDGFARMQSDTPMLPRAQSNIVRSIVQQDLRLNPDMGRKEPWKNMLMGKLVQAGVSETQAGLIADLAWRQHEIKSMNRELTEIQKAAEAGPLGAIVERIKNTPLLQQQGPDWREGVIRDYLREAGLSTKAAETAARLYNSIIIDRLAKAQQKAFEDTLDKSAPWKDYFARNARLAKGALEKIRLAVRTGALDPSRNLENVIAEQNGWTGFTDKQFQRLAELDEIISDPNVDDVTRTESIVEINKIVADAKLPVRLRDSLGAYYTGQALMGIPTALVNIASPASFAIRNLFTDIAKYAATDPKNIPIAFETFLESMRTWYDQVSYAFRNQIYRNDVVEYLAGNNTLRELFNKGKKQWGEGKYAEGFLNMSVGMAQITGRVLSSLDQGAISSLESQNLTRYALEAMKMAKIPKDRQKVFANKLLEARRKTKAQLVAEGMKADRAGVLADLEVRSLLMTELSSLKVDFVDVLESSLNDALQSVGRNRQITIEGLDKENTELKDKGLLSYLPISFLEMIAQGAATKGPAMQIFSRMLYGFALVPARVFSNVAWYSPVGLVRYAVDYAGQKTNWWSPRYAMSLGSELQQRQRLTEAISGSIVMLALASLVSSSVDDEDEDKAFRIVITGNGPDAATDRQFHDSFFKKYKPYTFHIIVNGQIIPINIGRGGEAFFFPIMLAGALDDWNIKKKLNQARKSPQELNQGVEMLGSSFFALAQRGPFAAFTKPLFDASKEGRVTEELVGQAGFFGKTFIPGIGASVARNISDLINDPVDRSSVMGSIYANTPIVGPMMGTKALNALGQPMRVDDFSDRLFRLGVPMVFSFPKNTPENDLNELIIKKGSGPSFPTRRVAQAAVGRPLDDKEFETYVREYGRVMSDKMFKNRKRLENMPLQQYDKELENYARGFSIDGIPISGARDAAVRAVNRMAQ